MRSWQTMKHPLVTAVETTELSKCLKTVVEALQSANEFGTYPSIQTLPHIFVTVLVTTSTTDLSVLYNISKTIDVLL